MFNAISNSIGGSKIITTQQVVNNLKSRILADGGTFEAESCLITKINDLKTRNFWNRLSAAYAPHGYKTNKWYAIKGDAPADVIFNRAGIAKRRGPTLVQDIATGIIRFDYSDSVCPASLLEVSRINLLLQSQTYENASWVKTGITPTANTTANIDGTITADSLLETATTEVHVTSQSIAKALSALTYSYTKYVKPNGRDWVLLECANGANGAGKFFNVTTGAIGATLLTGTGFTLQNASIKLIANGIYRCEINITSDATAAIVASAKPSTDGTIISYLGDITKGLFFGGSQLEQAAIGTTYVETTTATATRAADTISPLNATSLIGQTEGSLYFEGRMIADSIDKGFAVSDSTNANRVTIDFTATNTIRTRVISATVSQASLANAGFVTGTLYKALVSYQANRVVFTINGVKIGEDLVAALPVSLTQIRFDSGGGSFPLTGGINFLGIAKTATTDADAATVTA